MPSTRRAVYDCAICRCAEVQRPLSATGAIWHQTNVGAAMTRSIRTVPFIAGSVLLLGLVGCALPTQWTLSGGDREAGVVRVAYEYPEFRQPTLSDEQALKIAASRCGGWGYAQAEPIAGQIRQCSNMNGANCDLWTVTREYQCVDAASFAGNLAK